MSCDYNPYTLPTVDFVGGSTQELAFHTFFSQNKRPFDLSACTANFAVINFVNKNGTPLISKQMDIIKAKMEMERLRMFSSCVVARGNGRPVWKVYLSDYHSRYFWRN